MEIYEYDKQTFKNQIAGLIMPKYYKVILLCKVYWHFI